MKLNIKQWVAFDEFRWRHMAMAYAVIMLSGLIIHFMPSSENGGPNVFVIIFMLHIIAAICVLVIGGFILLDDKKGGKW